MMFGIDTIRAAPVAIACLLEVISTGGSRAEGHVVQYSSGQCSVNIANVSGNVTVEGGCMDQKVIALFLDTINRQQNDYKDKETEVELWIKRYDELAVRLGTSGAFSQLREEVKKRFKEGDLEGAGRAKDQIIAGEEGLVDELAGDYYDRAEILVLQLKPMEAQRFYAKAFQYRPENITYAEAYARNLCDTNQVGKAQAVYQISANELRSLAKFDPAKYSASLSCTLIDIAELYLQSGAYVQAQTAGEEALLVAHAIVPPDGKEALERIADALTSLGITALKRGEVPLSEAKLTEAEQIYAKINLTNSNRPTLFEALATIARQKNHRAEEETELIQAVTFEKDLIRTSALNRRSKLAMRVHLLFDFYSDEGDFKKAELLVSQFTDFVSSPIGADQNSQSFLSGVSLELSCELLISEGKKKDARPPCVSAIQTLESIKPTLRPKESTILSSAYDKLGWLNLMDAEYQSAHESFDSAVKVNLDLNGEKMRRAAEDRRMAQFFVLDFAAAANDLLKHSDGMAAFDRAMWGLVVQRRADPIAKLEAPGLRNRGDIERILIEVATGRSSLSLLAGAQSLTSNLSNAGERCRLSFFIGELLLSGSRISQGLGALNLCGVTTINSLYPWVIASEERYWSKQN